MKPSRRLIGIFRARFEIHYIFNVMPQLAARIRHSRQNGRGEWPATTRSGSHLYAFQVRAMIVASVGKHRSLLALLVAIWAASLLCRASTIHASAKAPHCPITLPTDMMTTLEGSIRGQSAYDDTILSRHSVVPSTWCTILCFDASLHKDRFELGPQRCNWSSHCTGMIHVMSWSTPVSMPRIALGPNPLCMSKDRNLHRLSRCNQYILWPVSAFLDNTTVIT